MQVDIVYSRFEFVLLNLCFPSWKLTNRLVLVPEPNNPGVKYEQDNEMPARIRSAAFRDL